MASGGFADRLGRADARLIKTFGEPFVYFDGESAVEVNGIFGSESQRVEGTRGPAIAAHRPNLAIAVDIVTEPKQRDLIYRGPLTTFVGEFDFEVVSVRADASEMMVTLVLKKVAP